MHNVFKRESKDFTFELNRESVIIISKDQEFKYNYVIEDFYNKTKSEEAGNTIQGILYAFKDTFKPKGDQRNQLLKGVRYFSIAGHYGVLSAAFPNEVLTHIEKLYESTIANLNHLEKEILLTKELVSKSHLNEPLVASTGLVVFPSLNHNWFVYETTERHHEIPEYLYSVIHHLNFKAKSIQNIVFTGTLNECYKYVLHKQRQIYGATFEDLKLLENSLEKNSKLAEDFELLLDTPYENTVKGKIEIAEKEHQLNEEISLNLHHLELNHKNQV